jgi:hypothetical protein
LHSLLHAGLSRRTDFHFAFPSASQHTPNRLRWDHFFVFSMPNDLPVPLSPVIDTAGAADIVLKL